MNGGSAHLRVFPLNTVLFPGARLDLHIFEPRYRQMIAECVAAGEPFGVCLIREGNESGDSAVLPHDVGTTAAIVELTELEQGRYFISTSGRDRFRIDAVISREPYLLCDVTMLGEEVRDDADDLLALTHEIRDVFREYLRLLVEFSGVQADVDLPSDPVEASFLIGDALQVADSMKQRLLEVSNTHARLREELSFLRRLLPQLRSLLERKRETPQPQRSAPSGGASRAAQEKFFGKHFSVN